MPGAQIRKYFEMPYNFFLILLPFIFRRAVASYANIQNIYLPLLLIGFWQKMTGIEENRIRIILYCFYNISTLEKLQYCRFSKICLVIRILNAFSQQKQAEQYTLWSNRLHKSKEKLLSQIFYLHPGFWTLGTFRLLKSRRIVNGHKIFLFLRFSLHK